MIVTINTIVIAMVVVIVIIIIMLSTDNIINIVGAIRFSPVL